MKPVLLLTTVSLCLLDYALHCDSNIFRAFEVALLQTQWMLSVCLAVWCGTFLFLAFSLKDLPLIGLLLLAIVACFIGYETKPLTDAITLLAGVTVGKGAALLLNTDCRVRSVKQEGSFEIRNPKSEIRNFLWGLVLLLALSSWWHLDMSDNFYHGPRWMGLWNNPNDYGLLMGVGMALAIGLLAVSPKSRVQSPQSGESASEQWKAEGRKQKLVRASSRRLLQIILFIAAGMIGVGLLFSYSRGAWVGTAIGLLYLAKAHGKFKWRFVLPSVFVVAAVVWFFWNATPETAPWYVKRMDFGRASAQHRVAAWKAGFEIMRDHPFGVGWNKAVDVYQKNYSPPENGAAAITTNDYLMLGTQLGFPGLLCFVAYVALCLGAPASRRQVRSKAKPAGETSALPAPPAACRAGAIALLVAFWFDGGLFKPATAAGFWILLELGASGLAVRNS